MKSPAFLIAFMFAAFVHAAAPDHTYSIVARDPSTGEIGVAVQTHWFGVGARVPWAEAGVGAVATQSFTEVTYGVRGLEMMRHGKSAPETLQMLVEADEGRDVRQVAMIDASGKVAAHTGKKCIAQAGHRTGKDYSVQANLMERSTVWDAMADTFESTKGDLAERMMAALEAGQKEGGDIRGMQSAAMIVVGPKKSEIPWKDRIIDLRVDDHPEPLKELRRLLNVHRAYRHMDRGDDLIAENKVAEGMKEYEEALKLQPQNGEIIFWSAISIFTGGEEAKAIHLLKPLFTRDPRWLELVGRLPAVDLLKPEEAEKIRLATQSTK